MSDLLEIPLSRFEPGRPLAAEVYLYLPLNQRTLLICRAGDELSAGLLQKLAGKGHSHLKISWNKELGADPATYPLFVDATAPNAAAAAETTTADAPTDILTDIPTDATEAPGDSVTATTETIEEAGDVNAELTPSVAPTKGKVTALSAEDENQIVAEEGEAELIRKVRSGPEAPIPAQKISSGQEEEEPSESFSADAAPVEAEQKFKPGRPPPQAEESFSSDPKDPETKRRVAAAKAQRESAQRIAAGISTPEEEQRLAAIAARTESQERFSGDEAEAVAEQRIGAGKTDAESAQRFGADAQDKEEEESFTFTALPEDAPPLTRLERRLEEAKESMIVGRAHALGGESGEFLRETKAALLSSKISERVISLSEESERTQDPEKKASLRDQIRSLGQKLQRVEVEAEIPAELLREFPIEKEVKAVETKVAKNDADQILQLSEEISALSQKRDLARQMIEREEKSDIDLVRVKSARDIPATVSRLAAYLGHSMGYTNVDFLSDLGITAIAQFEKKNGKDISGIEMPPFTMKVLSDEATGSTIDEVRSILSFLDVYIADPDCDYSQRDLVKKIFDNTIVQLNDLESRPDPWSVEKWRLFVDRGPSMDSHSVCTRAAAKAVKYVRTVDLVG